MRRLLVSGAAVAAVLAVTLGLFAPAFAADDTSTTVPVPETTHPGVNRVLVISIPTISWEDLDLDELPHLAQLFSESVVADQIVRAIVRVPTLSDGYLTIGAGTRAVGTPGNDGACLQVDEQYAGAPVREELARRIGAEDSRLSDTAVGCLAQRQIESRNGGMDFEAEIGLLGETLDAAGVERGVIGNGDSSLEPTVDADFKRYVGLSLADGDGIVPTGAVSSALLVRDPEAPFGIRLDPDQVLDAFERTWNDGAARKVVVVEASDLLRVRAYESVLGASGREQMLERALTDVDHLVGRLLEHVDPEHDAVLVTAPSQIRAPARLTVVSLRAPGLHPGLAVTNWTRHTGLVHVVDTAPTILDQLGLEPPAAMEGRPILFGRSGGSFEDRYEWMVDTNAAAQFRDREIGSVTLWFVLLQVFVTAGAVFAFVKLGHRALIVIELCALTLLGFLAALFLAGLVPFYRYAPTYYWLFLFAVGALIAAIAWLTTSRRGVTTLIVMLGAIAGVIGIDVATGARLQFNTVFGYTPTVSGRYAGMCNLAYSAFSASVILLAGLLAFQIPGRRGRFIAVALLAAAIVIDGAPMFGSDVGGVLSMVPAYALTATLLLGWKVRWRLVGIYAAATAVMIAIFAAIDLSRPVTKRTHLGRLVSAGSGEGGWNAVSSMIQRKMDANAAVYSTSVWSIMFPLVLAGIAYLIYRAPGRMRGLHERMPELSAALAGLGVLMFLGTALNDSGISVAGVMLGVGTPVMIVVTMRGDRARPRWAISPTADARSEPADPPAERVLA
jgi:hypothetical protein